MKKFNNKYRIQSHRRPYWDYSADALYFLTIVTQNRVSNLDKIVDNEIILSDFGKIVETEWLKSFDIRKELFLDEFQLMPNHLHAIVEIRHNGKDGGNDLGNNGHSVGDIDGVINGHTVETHGRASLHAPSPHAPSPFDMPQIKRNSPIRLPESISSFMAGFKSAVNTKIDDDIDKHQLPIPKYNRKNHFFQPNYHDHIIRNEIEYWNIKNYIVNNPSNWGKDSFNDKKG